MHICLGLWSPHQHRLPPRAVGGLCGSVWAELQFTALMAQDGSEQHKLMCCLQARLCCRCCGSCRKLYESGWPALSVLRGCQALLGTWQEGRPCPRTIWHRIAQTM